MTPSQEKLKSGTPNKETSLQQVIETVHRLRAPGGCPWDRSQTHLSLRKYLIEEAYEVLDVLDQIHTPEDLKTPKIQASFQEELGDLLMQVLLHSEMTREEKAFDIYDVAQGLNDKLIRRHPHVFGEKKADSADAALEKWEQEKAKEKASRPDSSVLEGVPKNLPALQRASRVIEKVTKVGFQWSDLSGPIGKLDEELLEFKKEIADLENATDATRESARTRVEAELGDLFFSLCNVASFLKISPEDSLRKTLARFERRFRHVEQGLKDQGKKPEDSSLPEMNILWDEAKELEKIQVWGLTGGIASGKSLAARFFSELGIPVVDADQIARELTEEGGAAEKAITKRFGKKSRTELREIIFADTQARIDLESILHPLIRAESLKRFKQLGKMNPVIIYEASLLVETGRFKDFCGLIVVEAPQEIRIQRAVERDGSPASAIKKITDSQTSDEERKRHAHYVLTNSGTQEELRNQVFQLISRIKPRG